MKVRALFIDMDGTLLTDHHEIALENKEAIWSLINQGVRVFLATGRPYEGTAAYHRELGLTTPFICLNGAAMYDHLTAAPIHVSSVRLPYNKRYQQVVDSSENVLIHTSRGLYCKKMDQEVGMWCEKSGIDPIRIGSLDEPPEEPVLKYSFRTSLRSEELISPITLEQDVIEWNDGFEVVGKGVSKYISMKQLMKAYRIPLRDVAAIGDGPNDIEMLQEAGTSAAMSNAVPEAKAAADFLTGSNNENGPATFITRYLLQTYAVV